MSADSSSPRLLAGRYEVGTELGRGGAATVYLAVDVKHGREVALKVFRPDLAAAIGAARFLREIEITAGLNHPHILPLLDSGEAGGLLFYVMPYVDGGSLRRLLAGGERISIEAVLRIAGEVASALDHAHAQGVVHRDIKPENILFSGGLAVVADFGVARAMSLAPRDHMTRTNVPVGTLGYMSPEQALGSEGIDSRTDVFSLGCVVYEMLTGATPASWPLPEDVRMGRLSEVPAAHRERLDALPGRVEQVLAHALALRPADRFATAGEMTTALVGASERTPALTDEEVRRLLDRAAELQALEPEDTTALTMGAVEQVAAQVGIPPEHVRRAARDLVVEGPRSLRPDEGAANASPVLARPEYSVPRKKWDNLVLSRIVEGEVAEEAFPGIVSEIQSELGVEGHASVLAGSLTWSPATQSEESRRVVVTIHPSDGFTHIVVHEEFSVSGIRRVLVGAGTAGVGLTALGIGLLSSLGPVLLIPGIAVGIPAAVQAVVRLEKRMRRPQLEAMIEKLAAMVGNRSA